jgi:hypothetical protein
MILDFTSGSDGSTARIHDQPRLRPQRSAVLFESGAQGIIEQVRVALGSLHLLMAKLLTDHRQRHPT